MDPDINDYIAWIRHLSESSPRSTLFAGRCRRLASFLGDITQNSTADEARLRQFIRVHYASYGKDSILQETPADGFQVRPDRSNRLLFMAGYPSARQLAEIGAGYGIDPDFFDAHLSFMMDEIANLSVHPSHYTLPSSKHSILQLSIQSVGSFMEGSGQLNWQRRRQQFSDEMGSYVHNLRMGRGWHVCDSIVRRIEIHDMHRFSLEQFVTVQISDSSDESTPWAVCLQVIIWSDAAADLKHGVQGPWTSVMNNIYFRPVTLHPWRICQYTGDGSSYGSDHSGEEVQQSASLLGPAYEQLFRSADVPARPLDSLVVLFRYFCAAEAHYLDMVATVLEDSIPDSHAVPVARKRESIPDIRRIILHSHRMLRRRRVHIIDILQYLDWHSAAVSESASGDVSTGKLLKTDLEHLLLSNADLMSRCQHDLDSMTSEATFEDAERGITLSKSSRKFTAFAAIYVPLAFTSSVFGMNFIQIDNNT
ncbi:hypothetical protein PG991_006239 [Apiospora marii]|uniref:Uncharacterized protein n=1 Tax=Apiospora marii TaxID=335849 RepID=A0ABR1SBH7_9PEZI